MQKLLLLLTLLVAAAACTNNQAAPGTAAATSPASSSDDAAVPGPASFSLTMDGTTVTGTSAGRALYNLGTTAIDPNDKPEFRFILADIKDPDGKPTRTVTFQSPIATGSHHVDCSGDDHFYGLMINFEGGTFDRFCGDDVVLNVTEVSDTRVKGNFSGKFTLLGRQEQKTVKVDCTFDIPRVKP